MNQIGILGAGQLGTMLAESARKLGITVRLYDPSQDPVAKQWAHLHRGAFDDASTLAEFAKGLDLVSYEFENIPLPTIDGLSKVVPIYPGSNALAASQDRWVEKKLLQSLDIRTAEIAKVDAADDLTAAVKALGTSAILKTRRLGYDGRGQWSIDGDRDVDRVASSLRAVDPKESAAHGHWILEKRIPFTCEVSQIAVRAQGGEMVFYDLCRNHHQDGILRSTTVWQDAPSGLINQAQTYARKLAEHLDYVGTLTIEFFVVDQGLVANEIAPRVHNSGHWTIEGAQTSQFENHIRAILGWSLGSPKTLQHPYMVNLISTIPERRRLLDVPGLSLHDYGKSPRLNRKLGHLTQVCGSIEERDEQLNRILSIVSSST